MIKVLLFCVTFPGEPELCVEAADLILYNKANPNAEYTLRVVRGEIKGL